MKVYTLRIFSWSWWRYDITDLG